jgi:Cu/Ag efflux protein CusF
MKSKLPLVSILLAATVCGCSEQAANTTNPISAKPISTASLPAATPVPTASVPKNGDYDGKGVVTKINLELGSVEMDHEEIKGVMPPMRMEFYVSDKKMLDGLTVGDKVDFVLRYKDHTETVVQNKKIP